MITEIEYKRYFGVNTIPKKFERLKYISRKEFLSIPINYIPNEKDDCYKDYQKALMEQINYFELNSDLLSNSSSGGYTLGSYSESGSNGEETNSKSISRISPIAYDILIGCGLLYSGIGVCKYD